VTAAESYGMLYRTRGGYWGHCLAEVYHPAPGRVVVVLTEQHGNDGPSITTAAADVWTLVEARHAPDPGVILVRIDHWDHATGPTWHLVALSRRADGTLHRPRWRRLSRAELAVLLA